MPSTVGYQPYGMTAFPQGSAYGGYGDMIGHSNSGEHAQLSTAVCDFPLHYELDAGSYHVHCLATVILLLGA